MDVLILLVESRGYSAGFLASALTIVAGLGAFLASERGRPRASAHAAFTN